MRGQERRWVMKLFDYTTHTRSKRYERLKMASIVANAVLGTNTLIKRWGNTIDDLTSIETGIRFDGERQKKTNTGSFMNNFQIEKGADFIKVWHTKITTGEKDELISEVFYKKEVSNEE